LDSYYATDIRSLITDGSLVVSKKKLNNEQLKKTNNLTITKKADQKNIKDDKNSGQIIAKISIIALLSIGITELIVGYWGGSIVLLADGVNSFYYTMLSFIVLIGLRVAHRPPNSKFPYGYQKVESFASLMVALGMIIIGAVIFYNSYQALLNPHEIKQPVITMVILAIAGFISLHRSFHMQNLANKYNIFSFKKDATNTIRDALASIIGFFSIVISTQLGILQMDAIGGMIIAVYMFSVSYLSLKKSSSILVDSCEDSHMSDKLKKLIMERFSDEIINVKSILIRPIGMSFHGEVHVELDGRKRFGDVDLLLMDIEMVICSKFSNFASLTIIPHSFKNNNKKFESIANEIKILKK
jgi:cation diffusion facilitator family transporter